MIEVFREDVLIFQMKEGDSWKVSGLWIYVGERNSLKRIK